MDWFKLDFDNFTENKDINYNPSLGICYRLRNPKYIFGKDSPIIYELTSQEDIPSDLDFIRGLRKDLKKSSESGAPEEFIFKLKMVPIPLLPSNDLGAFLYVNMGVTRKFCEKYNMRRAMSFTDKVGTSAILWGLENGKKPIELVFNYDFLDLPESSLRELKGHKLEEFLKSLPV